MKKKVKKTAVQKLAERLRDPIQFRIFVMMIVLAIGYVGVYMPLEGRITETTQRLARAKEHQDLVNDIDMLKAQVDRVVARLPKNTDTNEWIEYVLRGVRQFPVKLTALDSENPRQVGPFEAVVLRVKVQGEYHGMETFLKWIETNERLFRVDKIIVKKARGTDKLEMDVTILGLRG